MAQTGLGGAIRAQHERDVVELFLSLGIPLTDAGPVIPAYAEICSKMQGTGSYRNIGQNDLWIAAVCLAFDKPSVMRNLREFDKIEGLKLETLK